MGSSIQYKNFRLNIDFKYNENLEIYSGFEYKYGSHLLFMAGTSHLINYSLGIGIQLTHYNISYSFAMPKYGELGMVQKVTIGLDKNIISNLFALKKENRGIMLDLIRFTSRDICFTDELIKLL
mgnify:CR=1 FL=1